MTLLKEVTINQGDFDRLGDFVRPSKSHAFCMRHVHFRALSCSQASKLRSHTFTKMLDVLHKA